MTVPERGRDSFVSLSLPDGTSRMINLARLSFVAYEGNRSRFNYVCISPEPSQTAAEAQQEPEYILHNDPFFAVLAGLAISMGLILNGDTEVPKEIRSLYGASLNKQLCSRNAEELSLLAVGKIPVVYGLPN